MIKFIELHEKWLNPTRIPAEPQIEQLRSDYQFLAQEKAKLEGFLQTQLQNS